MIMFLDVPNGHNRHNGFMLICAYVYDYDRYVASRYSTVSHRPGLLPK